MVRSRESSRAVGGPGGFWRRVGVMGVAAAGVGVVGLVKPVMPVLMEDGRDRGEGDEDETKDHEDGGEPASDRDLKVPVHVQMRCK